MKNIFTPEELQTLRKETDRGNVTRQVSKVIERLGRSSEYNHFFGLILEAMHTVGLEENPRVFTDYECQRIKLVEDLIDGYVPEGVIVDIRPLAGMLCELLDIELTYVLEGLKEILLDETTILKCGSFNRLTRLLRNELTLVNTPRQRQYTVTVLTQWCSRRVECNYQNTLVSAVLTYPIELTDSRWHSVIPNQYPEVALSTLRELEKVHPNPKFQSNLINLPPFIAYHLNLEVEQVTEAIDAAWRKNYSRIRLNR